MSLILPLACFGCKNYAGLGVQACKNEMSAQLQKEQVRIVHEEAELSGPARSPLESLVYNYSIMAWLLCMAKWPWHSQLLIAGLYLEREW